MYLATRHGAVISIPSHITDVWSFISWFHITLIPLLSTHMFFVIHHHIVIHHVRPLSPSVLITLSCLRPLLYVRCPRDGFTALMEASYYGFLEVVKALVVAKADIRAKDNVGGGYTAWQYEVAH